MVNYYSLYRFILQLFERTFYLLLPKHVLYHITVYKIKNGELHALRFLSITLQNKIAAIVLTNVATSPGPTTAAGFTLPYWLLYGCGKLRLKNSLSFSNIF